MRNGFKASILLLLITGLGGAQDWKQVVKDRIAAYGHRNWVVIADSAYPAQSREGIETISADTGQVEALREVLADLSASRHVRPIAYVDQELKFIGDGDAPGADAYRTQILGMLPSEQTHALLHEQLIKKLDDAAQTFRVLIIKTKETIPYTSVFLQLNCAYWSDESEKQLRARMAR
ncbi:MAG TPA: RbsD/FucU domain-containing protein [Bryobacteraceae bacterium]|jgi:hypothetical protein|nr:RbsD/FucU domain-containing protein [Bryobacteraceae bacterium]